MSTIEEAAAKMKQAREASNPPPPPPPDEATAQQTDDNTPPEPEGETEGLLDQQPPPDEGNQERTTEAEQEADDGIQIEADQLAQLFGIEPEKLVINDEGQVRFKTNVEGEQGDATLTDFLERYQRDATLTNRSKDLAEQRKQTEALNQELAQRTQQMAQQQQTLLQELQTELTQEYQAINWQQLKADDPTEYTLKRQEFNERQQSIQNLFNQANQTVQGNMNRLMTDNREKVQKFVAEQQKLLPQLIPGWSDGVKNEISEFLTHEGFSGEEVAQVTDARLVKLAHMAMQFSKGEKGAKEKLVKPLPKVLKPGTKPSRTALNQSEAKKAQDRHKKEGTYDSFVAAMRARDQASR